MLRDERQGVEGACVDQAAVGEGDAGYLHLDGNVLVLAERDRVITQWPIEKEAGVGLADHSVENADEEGPLPDGAESLLVGAGLLTQVRCHVGQRGAIVADADGGQGRAVGVAREKRCLRLANLRSEVGG